jgi:hypothetical protein
VLRWEDARQQHLRSLLARFGLEVRDCDRDGPIPGSYWGAPEAGLLGRRVLVRPDTPLHSLLHEACHFVCMDPERRAGLDTDAGGDDAEEDAVCYLQILLGEEIRGGGWSRERLFADMDAWGYTFRLGSTQRWFEGDSDEALAWLRRHDLVQATGIRKGTGP